MEKRRPSSAIKIDSGKRQPIALKGDSNSIVGQSKILYKKPEIYMVPLHEITDIAQEDWFLETVNLVAGVALGYAVEKVVVSPDIAWIIIVIGSIAILTYRIRRRYLQDKKIEALKRKAIPIEPSETRP